jgi:Predicted membrane protein
MGIWLWIFEKKRRCAAIAIISGLGWFFLSTEWIIPHFSQAPPIAVGVYSFLGNSLFEISLNIILKPGLVLSKILTLANLEYLFLLLIPLIWGLSWRHLTPLMGAAPILFLNLLAENPQMKNLTQQYSLAILPFLLLAIIANLSTGGGWIKQKKWIILWSLICFFALAKYGYFASRYLQTLDNWQATREALTYIRTQNPVLTTDKIAPHLTHRPILQLAIQGREQTDLEPFQYVLLNQRHPGWPSSPELVIELVNRLKNHPDFQLKYHQDDVWLFEQDSVLK